MSLSIAEIISTLRTILPPDVLVRAETELENAEAVKQADAADAPPKAKSQFCVLLIDPDGALAGRADLVGHVVTAPEADDLGTVPSRLFQAAYAQNARAKRKQLVTTVADAGHIKRAVLKEAGLVLKTKEAVRVLVVANQMPIA